MRLIFCVLFILLFGHVSSFADDLNKPKGLKSKDQVKVLKVISQGYAQGKQSEMQRQHGSGCNTQVGVTNITKGAKVPNKVDTIVIGDVISVCK